MSEVVLNQALADMRRRHVNYFNGRLLTAESLRGEQTAQAARDMMLARASGFGVVTGLHVSGIAGATTLRVTAGEGQNRRGEVLSLGEDIDLKMLVSTDADAVGGFQRCERKPAVDGLGSLRDELYLLTVSATTLSQGRAPRLGGEQDNASCGQDRNVAALRFQVKTLAAGQSTRLQSALSRAVDGVAYWRSRANLGLDCLSLRQLEAGVERDDDFSALDLSEIGLAQGYRHSLDEALGLAYAVERLFGVRDHELPLAVLHWRDGGLRFVDMWAARRGLARATGGGLLAPVGNDMRDAAGHARMLQFQELIAQVATSDARYNPAQDLFELLPAAGFLPPRIPVGTFFPEDRFIHHPCPHPSEIRSWLLDSWRRAPTVSALGADMLLVTLPQGTFFMRCEPCCCCAQSGPVAPPMEADDPPAQPVEPIDDPEPEPERTSGRVVVYVGITGDAYTDNMLASLRKHARTEFTVALLQSGGGRRHGIVVPTTQGPDQIIAGQGDTDWLAKVVFNDVPVGDVEAKVNPLSDRFAPIAKSGRVSADATLALRAVFTWNREVTEPKQPGGDVAVPDVAKPGRLWELEVTDWLGDYRKLWVYEDLVAKYPDSYWAGYKERGGIPPELWDPVPEENRFGREGEVMLWVDPKHDPAVAASGPYAWLVRTADGMAVPVVLTTEPKADMADGLRERLGEASPLAKLTGVDATALAAAAWPSFMAGITGHVLQDAVDVQNWLAGELNLSQYEMSAADATLGNTAIGKSDVDLNADAADGGVIVAKGDATAFDFAGTGGDLANGAWQKDEMKAVLNQNPALAVDQLNKFELEYRAEFGDESYEAMVNEAETGIAAMALKGMT